MFPKGNVHVAIGFLTHLEKEDSTKQQLVAEAVISGEAFAISMFERIFH